MAAASNIAIGQQQQCANLSLRIFLCNMLSLYLFYYISILFFNLILISQLITFGSCKQHHHRPTATMQCANLYLRIFFWNMLWLYLFWHIYLLTEYCRSNNQNQILKLKIFNTLLTYWKKIYLALLRALGYFVLFKSWW